MTTMTHDDARRSLLTIVQAARGELAHPSIDNSAIIQGVLDTADRDDLMLLLALATGLLAGAADHSPMVSDHLARIGFDLAGKP
jgi:hypothetical protein